AIRGSYTVDTSRAWNQSKSHQGTKAGDPPAITFVPTPIVGTRVLPGATRRRPNYRRSRKIASLPRSWGVELVYLSLGSNVGDRGGNLRTAIGSLQESGAVKAISAFYEAEPVGLLEQPWFLNCVVAFETALSPRELLRSVLNIEQEMGRVRLRDKG